MADRSLHDRICALPGEPVDHRTFDVEPVSHPARADLEDYFMGTDSTDGKSLFAFLFSTFVLFTGDSPGADMGDIPV